MTAGVAFDKRATSFLSRAKIPLVWMLAGYARHQFAFAGLTRAASARVSLVVLRAFWAFAALFVPLPGARDAGGLAPATLVDLQP